jgi:hypothetical protein
VTLETSVAQFLDPELLILVKIGGEYTNIDTVSNAHCQQRFININYHVTLRQWISRFSLPRRTQFYPITDL